MLARFWNFLGLIFALDSKAFERAINSPKGFIVALAIVLVAGLSTEIAQGIVLFINRVKPVRFVFSLLINAIIFAAGYIFLVLSTWIITLPPWSEKVSFWKLAIAIGASYGPLIFSFLGALPYFGVPILALLSACHLFALVVAFATVARVDNLEAFGYVALGWFVLQLAQQTIGQPIANVGKWLMNSTAGVKLVTGRRDLRQLLQDGMQQAYSPSGSFGLGNPISGSKSATLVTEDHSKPAHSSATNDGAIASLLGLLGIILVAVFVTIFLSPLRDWVFGWHSELPQALRPLFDLFWTITIAIIVAGLLAPLETLGWWAGWYSDEVDTTINAGELAEPVDDPSHLSRYLVYLDGISKSNFEYLPDVEDFLEALTAILPDDIALIRGIVPYSVLNNPLDEDRPLAFLWRWMDKIRGNNPASLFGMLVNIRNTIIVAVSADRRYGPLYNQGIAQILYNGLLKNGYRRSSGIPITLIGYSGGAQMAAAAAPFLKRALHSPIEVISLGGVISGNCNVLELEHLYHLVGKKDNVEIFGPIMFPGRWKISTLSYWNRAKRRGKIDFISLGQVGHQVPGGLMDPNSFLPDGRSFLTQTLDYISLILREEFVRAKPDIEPIPSHYKLYMQADFNRPDYYPLEQSLPSEYYQPIAPWMGRLILPQRSERSKVRGALMEIYQAPEAFAHLQGQIINLRWSHDASVQRWVKRVRKDVFFSPEADYTNTYQGLVHPDRLDGWRQVDPLESLAGGHPQDDITVMLPEPLRVDEDGQRPTIYLHRQPIQITGRFYALVQFVRPLQNGDYFCVVHYNRASMDFDGPQETVWMPRVVADRNGCFPSTANAIEQSPLNQRGWYIYGARDRSDRFVVQAIAPRALFQLRPDRIIFSKHEGYQYIHKKTWANAVARKGLISSVLINSQTGNASAAIAEWGEGDRALLLHVYGGIGGKKREPAANTPIFFGHFAYGWAEVVREPLTDELRFALYYSQVYTHNTDGLVAGDLHWSRYLGDRQFGWVGTRPVADLLVKLDAFTGNYDFNGTQRSPLDAMMLQLHAMTARYRIGDGTGGTYVGAANNCSQDSNRALLVSIQELERAVRTQSDWIQEWEAENPQQAQSFRKLLRLDRALKRQFKLFGSLRPDWVNNDYNLGSTLEDKPLRNLATGLSSWRSLLPRLANDTTVKVFIDRGASVWVLRTNQIGGRDPDIEPIAPITF
ncbi:CAAX protease [Oscillatoria sp. FACHB-1406]|nr:CAAX protease [Oscillatoria sp. FACHB-1406]